MDTNTVKVITEFGQKLDNYINVLSSKLGVAAEHLWPVLVRQQVIEGWTEILITTFFTLSFLIIVKLLINFDFKNVDNDPNKQLKIIIFVIIGLTSIGFSSGRLVLVTQDISRIVNPEFHAIQSLSKMVK